jgi:hypothetical protein
MKQTLLGLGLLGLSSIAAAVGTAISYQGTLEELGLPAAGSYDFTFQLKNTGGANIGAAIVREDLNVVGGVFTTQLDFGSGAFTGLDRVLAISVRPGASTGAYTLLSPDVPVNAAPYALQSNAASTAAIADDVIDFAIDSIDIASGAVTDTKIASGAVTSTKLVDGAVTSGKLADDAVTAAKLASNSVAISNLIGGYNGGAQVSLTVAALDCTTADVAFGGGFVAGDMVFINTLSVLPDDITITALGVPSDGTIRLKFCNSGNAVQTLTNVSIRVISFR